MLSLRHFTTGWVALGILFFSAFASAQPCLRQDTGQVFAFRGALEDTAAQQQKMLTLLMQDDLATSGLPYVRRQFKSATQNNSLRIVDTGNPPLATLLSRQFQIADIHASQFLLTKRQRQDVDEGFRSAGIVERVRLAKASIESVGHNENTPLRLPPTTPHIKDDKGCIRAMKIGDLPTIGNGSTVQFNYDGFSEVAMLAEINEDATGYVKKCSAVIIGPHTALTARHCFSSANPKTGADSYIVLIGPQGVINEKTDLVGCKPQPTAACPFQVVQVDKPIFPTAERVPNPLLYKDVNDTFTAPDLALLKFSAMQRSTVTINRFAKLKATDSLGLTQNQDDTSRWLTIMGFGRSNSAKVHELSGGYWSSPLSIETTKGDLAVLRNTDLHQTRLCGYDSGGPMFVGAFTGGESYGSPRNLAALMSKGVGIGSLDDCKGSPNSLVQLITPKTVQWICELAPTVAGCAVK